MPVEHGCRLDQHHGVEDLRADSVKPHPEQPVGGEEPRAARALPTQNSHLVSQSNELELQRCTAAHPEREQGSDSGQKGDHADDGMGTAQETLHLVGGFDFCAGTGADCVEDLLWIVTDAPRSALFSGPAFELPIPHFFVFGKSLLPGNRRPRIRQRSSL